MQPALLLIGRLSVAYVFISFLNCYPFYTWNFFVETACQETMRFAYRCLINHGLDTLLLSKALTLGQIQTCIQQVLENFHNGNVAR